MTKEVKTGERGAPPLLLECEGCGKMVTELREALVFRQTHYEPAEYSEICEECWEQRYPDPYDDPRL